MKFIELDYYKAEFHYKDNSVFVMTGEELENVEEYIKSRKNEPGIRDIIISHVLKVWYSNQA